ncbi:MAG: hypothetical protein SWH61_05345 [Thermodesulfobacteriota bacterium]|nr:hypothetical protein [Thermodesulfobacteriota bacterium]
MAWDVIFETGTHTDSSGKTKKWTEADLDRIVNAYDPEKQEAPVVLGHPKTDSPAYGWVEKLKREGGKLFARYKQVPDALKSAIGDGRYKYKSIAVRPDGSLRHVGFLGAKAPAIKGLGPIQFEDGDAFCEIIFQEENAMDIEELKKKLAGEEAARKAAEEKAAAFAEKAEIAEAEKKAAEDARAKTEAEFTESRKAQEKAARDARFDKLVEDKKAVPAEKDKVLAFAEALGEGEEICFSEAEGKKPLEEHFWAFLESRKESHGLFSEYENPGDGDDDGKVDATLTQHV